MAKNRTAQTRRKPSIEALRALAVFSEAQTVSETARRLRVTQPVISRKLEVFTDADACGAVLLTRSGQGGLALTESAEAVIASIREIVEQYDRVIQFLHGNDETPRTVRVGTGNFAAEHFMPRVVMALSKLSDECKIETRVCRGQDRILATARGHFDMSLVTHSERQVAELLRESRMDHQALGIAPLGELPLSLAASKGSSWGGELAALSQQRAVPIDKLRQWELIGPDRQSGVRRQLEERSAERLYFVAEGGGWSAAKGYALAGVGVAILPTAILSKSDRTKLVVRRLAKEFVIAYHLIHRATPLNAAQQEVKKQILRAFAKPSRSPTT